MRAQTGTRAVTAAFSALANAAVILSTAIAMTVTASVAYGHHDGTQLWGSNYPEPCNRAPESQCVSNNATHIYGLSSTLSTNRANATIRALGLYAANSEVVASSSTGDWDVWITQANRPDVNAFAWGQCAPLPDNPLVPDPVVFGGSAAGHTRWCRPQYVYWNTWSDAANKVNSTAKFNYIGCHEIGHTLGLRHRGTTASCMVNASAGPYTASSVVPTSENPAQSDYDRIDNHYPL